MTPTLALVAGGPQITSQISLGVMILAAILGLAGLAFILYGARYKAAYEAEKAVTASLEAYRERQDADLREARAEAERQRELKHEALAEVATLRLQTDLTPVTARVAEMEDRVLARIEALQAASEKMTVVLGVLVEKANGFHLPEG